MDNLNLAALLTPLAGANPCGRDLESTLELYALEAAAKEPEEPGLKGVAPVDERNWAAIAKQALSLLEQSKDLRAVSCLARALLQTTGLVGYASAIALARGILAQHWEHAYPALEDDGQDADVRLNALRELWNPRMLASLRGSVVLRSRELGAFTVNDVLLAHGSPAARAGAAAPAAQPVKSALSSAQRELVTLTEKVRQAREDLRWMSAYVAERLGRHLPLNPSVLVSPSGERAIGLLDGLWQVLAQYAPATAIDPATELGKMSAARLEAEEPKAIAMGTLQTATVNSAGSLQILGQAHTREDVLLLLDQVCDYYARREPSSPVPLLVQRAKRIALMSFIDIMRDLADKGLPQVELWIGKGEQE